MIHTNQTVIYDASIEGFISAIRYLVMSKTIPNDIVSKDMHIPTIFEEVVEVTNCNQTDINSFLLYLKTRIHPDVIKRIFYAYLSEIKGFEITTLHYIIRGLKLGQHYLKKTTDEYVFDINNMCSKVKRECHRFYGLMRFQKTRDDIYYASFEPDHNIISLIIPHFVGRFNDQTWIIHDVKRGLAVLYEQTSRKTYQVNIDDNVDVEDDEDIRALWRCYFDSLKIESRINPKLQKRCMPQRYWKYLTEKKQSYNCKTTLTISSSS
ncbi:MAG: TIGR03915 family putative DNA repair protein [Thermodesulfovibrionales bacterium]|nr:TIGR03915 family putative DNA repair protein [Thermodesulfovibrionales bacterium]